MAFGGGLILCSPFNGRAMTQDGQVVAGLKLERKWKWGWNGKEGSDYVTTNDKGEFSFPVVSGSSLLASLLPHEPDVMQTITAFADSGPVEIWAASKKTYKLNSELTGRPIKVKCLIDAEPSADGLYWGTCVEDSE